MPRPAPGMPAMTVRRCAPPSPYGWLQGSMLAAHCMSQLVQAHA